MPPPRPIVPLLRRGVAACVAAAVVFLAQPAAAGPDSQKLVVVLSPEDSDKSPGLIAADHGVRTAFAAAPTGAIQVRNEYIDVSRSRGTDAKKLQREYLRRKYAGRKVDLLICFLSATLDFALEYRSDIFPGAPVVFAAVDPGEVAARVLPEDVTGVTARLDLTGTLDLALRVQPDTRRVYVVAGSAPFDAAWASEAKKQFRPFETRVEFVYLTGLRMEELSARLSGLPPQSVIYYLHVFEDAAGKPFIPADALESLCRSANAPVYAHADSFLGRGAVGGRMLVFEDQGTAAARLGLRILGGERPDAIAVPAAAENPALFDGRQLRRWGIDEGRLPPGSVLRYREPSFWDQYRWRVLAAVALGLAEALLIAGLVVQLVKRRRSDRRFERVVETAPIGMVMVRGDGRIVLVNAEVERLFGYARGELLGRPIEVLVPEALAGQHRQDRDRFFAAPVVRGMGRGRDLSGRRKDGGEIPIEIGLSPLRTQGGLFVLASILDLTKRRRAEDELRERERDLQLLTGRLLEAQEVERRRIARELHDDINQSLALLAVELDVLAAAPPDTAAKTADRVRAISGRVKEVSTAVHDLSHQLHPSKLEQLGLVAAVRSLCRELNHNLDIRFADDGVPEPLPPDVALCLYRIAQESLQNVVKHSGSRSATVELRGAADGLRLRVADDGVGFDPLAAEGGLGLASMRERLNLVRGQLVIDSRPGGGTRIEVRVPLPGDAAPR